MTAVDGVLPRVRLLGRPHQATHLHWQVFRRSDNGAESSASGAGPDAVTLEFALRLAKLFNKRRGELVYVNNVGRDVWAFEINEKAGRHSLADIDAPEGLAPIGPPKSIQLSTLFTCPEHSVRACQICPSPYLTADVVREPGSSSGIINLVPLSDVNEFWVHLVSAVVDRVAAQERWSGRRMAEKHLKEAPQHRLTPTPDGRLLLCLASSSSSTLPPPRLLNLEQGHQYTLWPLLETAIFVRSIELEPAIANRLYGDFADLVGRDWADGIAPEEVEWGGFLVPHKQSDQEQDPSKGIVTWWPICLVKAVPPARPEQISLGRVQRHAAVPNRVLASDAAAFFEVCAAQIQQDIEEERSTAMDVDAPGTILSGTQEQDVDLSLLGDPLPSANAAQSNGDNPDDSDSEDLFESTPTPPTRSAALPAVPDSSASMDGLPVNKDSVDAVSSAVQSPAANGSTRPTSEYGGAANYYGHNAMPGGIGDAMITDDDFNFFDEPEYGDEAAMEPDEPAASMLEKVDGAVEQHALDSKLPEGIQEGPLEVDQDVSEKPGTVVTHDLPPDYQEVADSPVRPAETDRETVGTARPTPPALLLAGPVQQSPAQAVQAQSPGQGQWPDADADATQHDPVRPGPNPFANLVPAAFSAITFPEDTASMLSQEAAARRWPTQATLASRSYDPRGALKDRLKRKRALYQALPVQFQETASAFIIDPAIDDDGSLDGISDSCPTDDVESMAGSADNTSVEAVDSPQAPSPRDQSEPALSFDQALSIKTWLIDVGQQQHLVVPLEKLNKGTETDAALQDWSMEHIDEHPHTLSAFEWGCLAAALIHAPDLRPLSWSGALIANPDLPQAEVARGEEACDMQNILAMAAATTGAPASEIHALCETRYQVAHNGNILQVAARALDVWNELGLQPINYHKRITPIVIFDASCATASDMETWLYRLSYAFKAHNLGILETRLEDDAPVLRVTSSDMLVASVRTALEHAVHSGDEVLVIVVADLAAGLSANLIRTHSTVLADLASGPSHLAALAATTQLRIIDAAAIHDASSPARLAMSIYESTQQVIIHQAPRIFGGESIEDLVGTVPAPAFTRVLPETARRRPYFSLKWPPPTQDLLDGQRVLHVAYGPTSDGRAVVAFALDSRGEVWDSAYLSGWDAKGSLRDVLASVRLGRVLAELWDFVMGLARRAAVEWSIVVVRTGGLPTYCELLAWRTLLTQRVEDSMDPLGVFLCAYDDACGLDLDAPSTGDEASVVLPLRLQLLVRQAPDSAVNMPILPVASALHLRYPGGTSAVHLLLTQSTVVYTLRQSDGELLRGVVQDYHDLQDLGARRWALPRGRTEPAHIGMVRMLAASMNEMARHIDGGA